MTRSRRQPASASRNPQSGSAPTTPLSQESGGILENDYPDSQQPVKNPLSTDRHSLTRQGEIRKRLGVTDAQMRGVPLVADKLREGFGSVGEAIQVLEGDDSPKALQFMEKWNSLSPSDQRHARIEDVIIAAGFTPREFMETLAGASFEYSSQVSKVFVSHSQLKVLKATVKAATDQVPITETTFEDDQFVTKVVGHTNGDVRAMEIFHKITGALPTPKGASFTLNQQINGPAKAEPVEQRPPLQTMDQWLLEIDDIRKPKQLAASTPVEIPVEMPENAPEIEYLPIGDDHG